MWFSSVGLRSPADVCSVLYPDIFSTLGNSMNIVLIYTVLFLTVTSPILSRVDITEERADLTQKGMFRKTELMFYI